MCRFLETIKIVRGEVKNLHFHQQRMDKTLKAMRKAVNPFLLEDQIRCPEHLAGETVKCRVLYDVSEIHMEYAAYSKLSPKLFKLVDGNLLNYQYKFADRSAINQLYDQKQACDDIIITQNGLITDASSANLVFRKNRWFYTPAHPLLEGTKRQRYLEEGRLRVKVIPVTELQDYEAFKCINAMLDLEDTEWIPVSCIL